MTENLKKIETCRTLATDISGPTTLIYALSIDRSSRPSREQNAFTGGAFAGSSDSSLLFCLALSSLPELASRHPEASHLKAILPDPFNPESAFIEFGNAPVEPEPSSFPVELHPLEVPADVFDSTLRIDEDLEPIEGPLHDLYEALWKLDGFFFGEGLYGLYNNTYYDAESEGPNERFLLNLSGVAVGGGGKFFFYDYGSMWIQ